MNLELARLLGPIPRFGPLQCSKVWQLNSAPGMFPIQFRVHLSRLRAGMLQIPTEMYFSKENCE